MLIPYIKNENIVWINSTTQILGGYDDNLWIFSSDKNGNIGSLLGKWFGSLNNATLHTPISINLSKTRIQKDGYKYFVIYVSNGEIPQDTFYNFKQDCLDNGLTVIGTTSYGAEILNIGGLNGGIVFYNTSNNEFMELITDLGGSGALYNGNGWKYGIMYNESFWKNQWWGISTIACNFNPAGTFTSDHNRSWRKGLFRIKA